MPVRVRPGDEFGLTFSCVGVAAITHAEELWDAPADAGGDVRAGFDPDRTTFEFVSGADRTAAEPTELPPALAPDEPLLPRVRVELTAPLFLRGRDERGRRRHVE